MKKNTLYSIKDKAEGIRLLIKLKGKRDPFDQNK